jgi:transcriptional regulator with XRE-family HTH domain
MYNPQNTADRIKKILIDKKITAKKMCEECGIGVNTLSNIRRGDVKSIETFSIIANYLGCSVDYLLGRTDKPEVNK